MSATRPTSTVLAIAHGSSTIWRGILALPKRSRCVKKRLTGWRAFIWTAVISVLILYLTSFVGIDAWLAKAE
jgi:hypothetical protein